MRNTISLTARDLLVLKILRTHGQDATYVIRNWIHDFGKGEDLTTAQVLRSCKKLERANLIERVPTSYQVMITWRALEGGAE